MDDSGLDREKIDETLVQDALRGVLGTEGGRFYLWYLLDRLGPYRAPALDGDHVPDDRTLLANAVKQAVGIELLGDIRAADIGLARLMEDEADERRRHQQRRDAANDDDDVGRPSDRYTVE